ANVPFAASATTVPRCRDSTNPDLMTSASTGFTDTSLGDSCSRVIRTLSPVPAIICPNQSDTYRLVRVRPHPSSTWIVFQGLAQCQELKHARPLPQAGPSMILGQTDRILRT